MQTPTVEDVKQRIAREVERLHPRLIEISHAIYANPEIMFQERYAAALLADELKENGFAVEQGVAGLETSFVATRGEGRPAVALLAEYDALPKMGHACGHNLIAAWAIGAGIAIQRALPNLQGTIKVIGTPAEEGGGGKVSMVDAGVFRSLDAAIMMHPRDATYLDRGSLAVTPYTIEFFGKSAHAAASPEEGVNALDAVLQIFFSVNALRQSFRPHARIHGTISHGGDAPNIIPDYAAAKFMVRAREQEYHEELRRRFLDIVEAAALATGTRLQVQEGLTYQTRISNLGLLEAFAGNMAALGVPYEPPAPDAGVGSSDIGNVSQVVPTIHPYLQICEKGTAGHTTEFGVAARSELADQLIATGSTLLAWTAADVLLRPEIRERVLATFRQQLGRDPQR